MAEQLPQPKTLQPGGAADAPSREELLATLSLEPVPGFRSNRTKEDEEPDPNRPWSMVDRAVLNMRPSCAAEIRTSPPEAALEGPTLIEDEDPNGPNLPKPSPRRRLVHKARLEFIYPDGSIVEIPEGEYNDYEHIQRTMYEQAKWQQACDWAKAPDDADIVAPDILEAEAQWAGEQAAMEKWEADNHKRDTVGRR